MQIQQNKVVNMQHVNSEQYIIIQPSFYGVAQKVKNIKMQA